MDGKSGRQGNAVALELYRLLRRRRARSGGSRGSRAPRCGGKDEKERRRLGLSPLCEREKGVEGSQTDQMRVD
jgi:hypothetical protein